MIYIYIYDIWYMIYDIWYMIYDIWYMIYDIWYMIYDAYFLLTFYCWFSLSSLPCTACQWYVVAFKMMEPENYTLEEEMPFEDRFNQAVIGTFMDILQH